MILVNVQAPSDVIHARALVDAIGQRIALFLLVAEPAWLPQLGALSCAVGHDPRVCMLNPQNFDAVVSFSGERLPERRKQLLLLSYFDEIGVPTLELQHALFQPGMWPFEAASAAEPELVVGYAARHLVRWGGESGIGYLRPVAAEPAYLELETSFVLIHSSFAAPEHSSRERHQFVLALLSLVSAYPKRRFVWLPDPVDLAAPDAADWLALVDGYALPQLRIERTEPLQRVIPRCEIAISTLSNALIDLDQRGTPVLVFAPEGLSCFARGLGAETFANGPELVAGFARLDADPAAFGVRTGLAPADTDALLRAILGAIATRDLDPNFLPVALRYLPAFDVAAATSAAEVAQHVSAELERVLAKLAVLHRSTLAYKAKRFVKQLRFGHRDGPG